MKELTHDKKLEALGFIEAFLKEKHGYICFIFITIYMNKNGFQEGYQIDHIKELFPELNAAIDRLQMAENGINYDIYEPIWNADETQKRIELINQVRAELMDDGQPF